MNPLKCVIVAILYFFGVICKGQGVFISKDETKWDNSSCTLAKPKVECRDDGKCIVKNGLEFLTSVEDQDNGIWIAYAKTWISFAYVGCGLLTAGDEFSVSTFGECKRTTGCQTFGIQKSKPGLRCKCASINASRIQTCGEICRESGHYPCGGTANTSIFSIYTVENVPPTKNSIDIPGNCLLFYYNYEPEIDYYWRSCKFNTTPALLCSNTYDYNPMAEIHNRSDELWAKAMEYCITGRKFPASIQSIKNVNFTNLHEQDHWTGIIRKRCIISLSAMLDNSTNPPFKYAYVKPINETVYVRFANNGDKRKSLCVGDGTSAGPTRTPRETQPSYLESTSTPAKRSTAGLAAGVSVSLVFLIIVTVIVLVFLKRRGLLTKCYTQNDEKSNYTEDTATEISCISTPTFESTTSTTNDLTATNHSYFVLEKQFDGETKEETDHYAEPDMTDVDHYDLTEKSQKHTVNDYDTADGKESSAKSGLAKPNNSYNKVTLHQMNEYDHINGRPPKSDRQTENEYDLSNNLIDGNGNDNFGDDSDTYNHLNKHELKNSGTDNVYGKSETDGDSGYDTSGALNLRRNIDANDQQADYAVIKKKW